MSCRHCHHRLELLVLCGLRGLCGAQPRRPRPLLRRIVQPCVFRLPTLLHTFHIPLSIHTPPPLLPSPPLPLPSPPPASPYPSCATPPPSPPFPCSSYSSSPPDHSCCVPVLGAIHGNFAVCLSCRLHWHACSEGRQPLLLGNMHRLVSPPLPLTHILSSHAASRGMPSPLDGHFGPGRVHVSPWLYRKHLPFRK